MSEEEQYYPHGFSWVIDGKVAGLFSNYLSLYFTD